MNKIAFPTPTVRLI